MTDTSPSAPRADTQEGTHAESRPVPVAGFLAAALAPGRSYHERQRELVQASLIARWVPEQATQRPQR